MTWNIGGLRSVLACIYVGTYLPRYESINHGLQKASAWFASLGSSALDGPKKTCQLSNFNLLNEQKWER